VTCYFISRIPEEKEEEEVRGGLYSSCVRSSMLHRSETWPIRTENEVALSGQR